MFCEDAARRLAEPLRALPDLAAFKVRVEHEESLHAHDAWRKSTGSGPEPLPRPAPAWRHPPTALPAPRPWHLRPA